MTPFDRRFDPRFPNAGEPATVPLPRLGPAYAPQESQTPDLGSLVMGFGRMTFLILAVVVPEVMLMVFAFQGGEYPAALMVVCFNVSAVGVLIVLWARRHPAARGAVEGGGVTLRPGHRLDVSVLVALLAGVAGSGLFAYLQLTTDPTPRFDTVVVHTMMFNTFSPLLGAAVLLAVTVPLLVAAALVALRGTSRVRLNPDGFAFDSLLSSASARWDDVCDIPDSPPSRRPFQRHPVAVLLVNGAFRTFGAAGNYAPEGDVLREMMRFYWRNRGYRIELGDDRALSRFRAAAG